MQRNKTLRLASILLGATLVGLWLASSEYKVRRERTLPPELIGTWVTEHPKYRGLSLEINPSAISLETAEGEVHTYDISEFERSGEGQRVSYSFFGTRDGLSQGFFFFYTPSGGGEIRFRNQIEAPWKKAAISR